VFQEALIQSLTQLEAAKSQGYLRDFALIGGLAVAAWGVPRATQDLGFAAAVGSADPHAAAAFLGGRYDAGDPDDPLQGVIHLSIGPSGATVPLQLVLFPTSLAQLIFRHVESLPVMGRSVPIVCWQVMILLKLYAGGPQDRLDAQQILNARQPQRDELHRMARMAESVGLSDEWTAFSESFLSQ
jgi:hypothetical protein